MGLFKELEDHFLKSVISRISWAFILLLFKRFMYHTAYDIVSWPNVTRLTNGLVLGMTSSLTILSFWHSTSTCLSMAYYGNKARVSPHKSWKNGLVRPGI